MSSAWVKGIRGDVWGPLFVLLGPPLLTLVVALWMDISQEILLLFIRQKMGDIASVWGLFLGLYILFVATGAKRAAVHTQTKVEGRDLARELEDARKQIEQLGVFVQDKKWDLVHLISNQVLSSCTYAIARWGDHPSQGKAKVALVNATTIVRSIVKTTSRFKDNGLTTRQVNDLRDAQVTASELLVTALGESRKIQERELL